MKKAMRMYINMQFRRHLFFMELIQLNHLNFAVYISNMCTRNRKILDRLIQQSLLWWVQNELKMLLIGIYIRMNVHKTKMMLYPPTTWRSLLFLACFHLFNVNHHICITRSVLHEYAISYRPEFDFTWFAFEKVDNLHLSNHWQELILLAWSSILAALETPSAASVKHCQAIVECQKSTWSVVQPVVSEQSVVFEQLVDWVVVPRDFENKVFSDRQAPQTGFSRQQIRKVLGSRND